MGEGGRRRLTKERQRATTRGFVRNLLETLESSVPLLGVVLFADREQGAAVYQDRVAGLLDTIADVPKSNLASWAHREFDPDLVATAVVGMCWGLRWARPSGGRPLDVDAAADEVCDLVFRGLSQPGP